MSDYRICQKCNKMFCTTNMMVCPYCGATQVYQQFKFTTNTKSDDVLKIIDKALKEDKR